jgi:hypothetical protein
MTAPRYKCRCPVISRNIELQYIEFSAGKLNQTTPACVRDGARLDNEIVATIGAHRAHFRTGLLI